jgi:hypothetical protein
MSRVMPFSSQPRALRAVRSVAACLLAGAIAFPDAAHAASGKSMDAMSDAELERFVQQLNQEANWRKYRRPGDPADFVPGQPVKVMFGAGAFGKGGGRNAGAFRRSGLGSRRSGLASRRRGRDDAAADSRSSRSTRNQLGSSRSGSSFGGSRSSTSSRSSFDSTGVE